MMSDKNKGAADAGRFMLGMLSPDLEKSNVTAKEWAKMTPDQRRYELEKAVGLHPEKVGG